MRSAARGVLIMISTPLAAENDPSKVILCCIILMYSQSQYFENVCGNNYTRLFISRKVKRSGIATFRTNTILTMPDVPQKRRLRRYRNPEGLPELETQKI